MESEIIEMSRPNLVDSKKAICDWIMSMTVKEYFDFMGSVLENMPIPVAETITEEMFLSGICPDCWKNNIASMEI